MTYNSSSVVCNVEMVRCVLNHLHDAIYSNYIVITGNGYTPNIRVAKQRQWGGNLFSESSRMYLS